MPPLDSRRKFLGTTAGSAVALASGPLLAQADALPSQKVTVGIMGLKRGMEVAAALEKQPGVVIKYVCDVDSKRANDRLIEERPDDAGGGNPWLAVDTFHTAHFVAAIRSGDHFGLSAQIEKGHRSTLLCHLGNIAYRTQRTLKCNPENGHVLDDEAAMAFWQREYEPGWTPIV